MRVSDLLSTYLNDHLTGATAGLELFRRAARTHAGTDRGNALQSLARDVETDRDRLRRIMADLDVRENKPMQALGWVGEKAGRLKPNGFLVRRSPLSDLVELEGLRIGVAGKIALWQVLRAAAVDEPRLHKEQLEELLERAEEQSEQLYRLHLQVAQGLFDQG